MKSNRSAKRLLEVSIWAYDGAYRLSNRKREFCNEDGDRQVITQQSRRQRKAKRVIEEIRQARVLDRIFINNDMVDSMVYAMRAMIAFGGGQRVLLEDQ